MNPRTVQEYPCSGAAFVVEFTSTLPLRFRNEFYFLTGCAHSDLASVVSKYLQILLVTGTTIACAGDKFIACH